ncbi:amino acid ABC transporter permease [Prauserella alba]|uniref:Amino acid ABC transporter permease n=1 Tax=Prauserella alba TaxID=176898 RepID=A0ABN1VGL0_9PSEU|nr:amino acid ABC transporter permease [Prauserella alba]MCP2182880.1 polar amino acid transport system permease protein [Prauserella alba]
MNVEADTGALFQVIGTGLVVTILMTVVSFCAGSVLAVPVALMRTSRVWLVRAPATAFIDIVRGIPTLVWLLIIFYGLGSVVSLDPLPAALIGLTLISSAYLAENFRAGIENVHVGQKEAAAALGLSTAHQFWRVVAPQAVNIAMPPSASYAVALLKDTAIAAIIGVTDIIFFAQQEVARGAPAVTAFLVAGAFYLIVSVPLSYFSRFVDHKIRQKVVVV